MTHASPIMVAAVLSVIAMPAMAADPSPQRGDQAPPASAAVSPLAAQPFDRLSATRERPLFSPTRRPPAPPPEIAAPPPPPPPPPTIVLLAVVMDGEEARAVVRAGPEAKIMRVGIGDDIGGWKVGQIEARQLVLSRDDRSAKFTMFSRTSADSQHDTGGAAQPARSVAQRPSSAPSAPALPSIAAPPNTEAPHAKRRHRQR